MNGTYSFSRACEQLPTYTRVVVIYSSPTDYKRRLIHLPDEPMTADEISSEIRKAGDEMGAAAVATREANKARRDKRLAAL